MNNLITNWRIESVHGVIILIGRIYNDTKQRFPDGVLIHTSPIEDINIKQGIVKTRNTIYNLDLSQ